jgi:formylglycine-generating enzyme
MPHAPPTKTRMSKTRLSRPGSRLSLRGITLVAAFILTPLLANPEAFDTTMVLIPPGRFLMGSMSPNAPELEKPQREITLNEFYIERTEVSKALWDEVRSWALLNGYEFSNPGQGKAAQHPVHSISWFDAVKWCNARSEKERRKPAYFTDKALTHPYRSGEDEVFVDWHAGYRLPTEAEWEKAARGGRSESLFPWDTADTISHDLANYFSVKNAAHDVNPTPGYHTQFKIGEFPYTSPVASFRPNSYGLFDMAGNVWEWCWDWHGPYSTNDLVNPRGPQISLDRVLRGGGWNHGASHCRVTARSYAIYPRSGFNGIGFRPVLPIPNSPIHPGHP